MPDAFDTDISTLTIETERLKSDLADLDRLGRTFGNTLTRAFASAVVDGRKLSDVLRSLALSLSSQALSAALKPLGDAVGAAMSQAVPFAQGGIVSSPTYFALKGAMGVMGEKGAEAIMPLARGPDGRLGVSSNGGRAINVTVNIATRDAESFRQSQSQVAATFLRALERGQRNL
jgi:phage-related minor tail protein